MKDALSWSLCMVLEDTNATSTTRDGGYLCIARLVPA